MIRFLSRTSGLVQPQEALAAVVQCAIRYSVCVNHIPYSFSSCWRLGRYHQRNHTFVNQMHARQAAPSRATRHSNIAPAVSSKRVLVARRQITTTGKNKAAVLLRCHFWSGWDLHSSASFTHHSAPADVTLDQRSIDRRFLGAFKAGEGCK